MLHAEIKFHSVLSTALSFLDWLAAALSLSWPTISKSRDSLPKPNPMELPIKPRPMMAILDFVMLRFLFADSRRVVEPGSARDWSICGDSSWSVVRSALVYVVSRLQPGKQLIFLVDRRRV